MGKMRHHGANGKNDENMEGIPVDLDENNYDVTPDITK
jgi:hypothetical protein